MRIARLVAVLLLALVAITAVATAEANGNRNFVAHLSGSEEVPPADTVPRARRSSS